LNVCLKRLKTNCDGEMTVSRVIGSLSDVEQYILLFLSDGKPKRFKQIFNYLKGKGFNMSGQYLIHKLNRLISLKFILPRPHPTRQNAKTYQITPLFVKFQDEHAVVVHSPVFRRPVVIYPSEYKGKIDVRGIVKRGYDEIVKKVENGDIDHKTIVELLMSLS